MQIIYLHVLKTFIAIDTSRTENKAKTLRGGGGGAPLYKLYGYVRRQRVWLLSPFGLKLDIGFDHWSEIG